MAQDNAGSEKQIVHLQIASGPDKGRMFFLQPKREALIGRHLTADLRLTDPGASQKHCVVRSAGDMVFIEDLNSRNGTAVNGERITNRVLDQDGKIQVGSSIIDVMWVATESAVPLSAVKSDFAPTLLEKSDNTAKLIRLVPEDGSTIVGAAQLADFRAAQKQLGKIVAGFLLLEVIGAGGLGFVFRAKNIKSKEEIALKLIRRNQAKTPERLARFLSECRTDIDVPNAVRLLDVGEDGEYGFISMHLVRGRNVQSAIENNHNFSLHETLVIVSAIGETLHAAHQQGVVHRDVRPSNIVQPESGKPVLLDLGMGKKTDSEGTPLVPRNDSLENLSFMSPELTREAPLDARTDVYALAATAYSILSGHKPFKAKTHLELVRKIRWDAAALITDHRQELPPALAGVIARAMEKEPERRYPDMPEFLSALKQAAG